MTCIDSAFMKPVCVKKTSMCDGVTECQGGEDEDKDTCEKYKEVKLTSNNFRNSG